MKKFQQWGVIILLFAFCSLIPPGSESVKAADAMETAIVDQEQPLQSGNIWVNAELPKSQSFMPAYSGYLSKIDINIFDYRGSPGALKIEIYDEGNMSVPIASATRPDISSGWLSVDFSNNKPYLKKNMSYRMIISTENGGINGFGWYGKSGNPYPRGSAFDDYDFSFRTYMIPDYSLSPAESQISVSSSTLVADGVSQAIVTVKLKDAQGTDMTTGGESVTISSTQGTVSAVTDNNNGTYTATLTASTTTGTGTISGTVGGKAIAGTASVQFVPGSPSTEKSTVGVNIGSLFADGISQATITVKLKDAQNNEIKAGGAAVAISSTLGTVGNVVDHNSGTYTATLTAPITVGTATISASVGGNPITATASVQLNPKPAQSVTATVATSTPIVGMDNSITLSVKNALGDKDTTFNGIKNVTISGYKQAPNGFIGSFNGQILTSMSEIVALNFTNGEATSSLKLNAALAQTIELAVSGVDTATTNSLIITPIAGNATVMKLTTDIIPPSVNGGAFGQQPVLTLYDGYGNVSVNDNTNVVTVTKKDVGAWTLTGTLTATANAGIISFSNLGAMNAAKVTGAQLAFDAPGLAQLTSTAVTLIPKQYTVGFDTKGGNSIADLSITHGDKLIAPTEPIKTGYTFVDWYKNAGFTTKWDFATDVIMADTMLYAKWTVNSYGVTFNTNGGSVVASDSVIYNEKVTKPTVPSKAGYTFAGWFKESALTTEWDFAIDVITADTTLYAKWTVNSYGVTFNTNGGSVVASDSVIYNEKVTKPTAPSKAGYTFAGWFKESALATEWDFATDEITANTTLYAKWTVNSYDVAFNTNGGSVVASDSVIYNEKVTKPTAPSKAGHTFAGWFKESALATEWDFATDVIMADTMLYAKWTVNSYGVTFNTNGGSVVASDSVIYNEKVTKPTVPSKAGYTFAGWFKESALATEWDFATDVITAETTLYAKWTVNSYSVTFNTNGGSAVASESIVYKEKVTKPKAPTKAGYTFMGWYKNATFTTEWNFTNDVVTEDITLYAKWTVNSTGEYPSIPTTPTVPVNPVPTPTEPSIPENSTPSPEEHPDSEPTEQEPEQQQYVFSDVPKSHWAWEMIQDMARRGVITGYPDQSFRPNEFIKRQHIAIMLTRAFELEPSREATSFSDVLPSHPYYEAITKLQRAGIIDGSNGAFHPDEWLTRAQMAKILVAVLQLPSGDTSSFKDVSIDHWSYANIAALEQQGIALGSNGYFKPNDPVTRAQFVALMYRALNQ
ncbi:InlB B-repeat-containing protein [Lysinibacillus sp. NPDC047702]|uniref:InlB B-repeat-containing protein n=1 Tax=unclassified Lysinibacillus TaxID=2636778 RepID=UPI003D0116C5